VSQDVANTNNSTGCILNISDDIVLPILYLQYIKVC